jgi:hypothetical protein
VICQPLCTTVGVCRCVFESTMSMKSLLAGTTWMLLKLYVGILAAPPAPLGPLPGPPGLARGLGAASSASRRPLEPRARGW